MGTLPVQLPDDPKAIPLGRTALFLGYFGAFLKREERPVSHELMQFHRKEQMRKLKNPGVRSYV